VNVLDHLYRLACFAYAFHYAPRLSGGAAGPSRSAGLGVQCTSSTPTCGSLHYSGSPKAMLIEYENAHARRFGGCGENGLGWGFCFGHLGLLQA